MIDSISFRVPGGKAPDLERLTLYREDYYRGMLGNMRVTQSPDGVYCTGSLARYLQGNNVLPLTRQSVQDALGQLEHDSGWNLKSAELYQVEIGSTIPVDKQPSAYLGSWGNLSRFVKQTYQKTALETVTYSNGMRAFTGYDKRREAESKQQAIPGIYAGAELIRLELKYRRKLKQRMGRPLNPWNLADRETYSELVQHWQAFYFLIPKGRIPVIDTTGGISPKDLDNALKAFGLQALGYDEYLNLVSGLERQGLLGRIQAGRARNAAKEAARNERISHVDYLTAELDSRVREAATYAR